MITTTASGPSCNVGRVERSRITVVGHGEMDVVGFALEPDGDLGGVTSMAGGSRDRLLGQAFDVIGHGLPAWARDCSW